MKILVLAPYYPPHVGGLENFAHEFNEELIKKIETEGGGSPCEITVLTPQIPVSASLEQNKGKIKVIRFPAFEIIPKYPLPKFWHWNYWLLFWRLLKKDYDLVITHTRFFALSLDGFTFSFKRKSKWLHIEHGSDWVKLNNKFYNFLAKVYDFIFGKFILKKADRVVAVSSAAMNFVFYLAKREAWLIYRGFDLKELDSVKPVDNIFDGMINKVVNSTNITDSAKSNNLKIIFVGRLIDGKGISDLIEAVKDISGVDCFIVGEGPQLNKIKDLIKSLKIENKVFILGQKSYKEAIALIKAADVLVNPSYTEGLPTVVVEAALCKKAIIATDVGGTNEVIEDGQSGILIQPGDSESLKAKIELLKNNEDLRKNLGERAYEDNKNKFTWKECIIKYEKVINELLNI